MSRYSQSSATHSFSDSPLSSEHGALDVNSLRSSTDAFDNSSHGDVEAKVAARLKKIDFVLWLKTAQRPLRISARDTATHHIPPHVDIPPVKFVEVLQQPAYVWKTVKPEHVPLVIPSFAQTVLIKFPTTLNCVDFIKELKMLDEKTGDVGPSTWDVVDMLKPVPTHNCGDYFTVVAYAQNGEPPKFFFLRLTTKGEIRWRDWPLLLELLLGPSEASYPPVVFLAWAPMFLRWDVVDPDVNFTPTKGCDFMIVRHKSSEKVPGLPHFLVQLDAQIKQPVTRLYRIPCVITTSYVSVALPPSPSGTPPALSALYIRNKMRVSMRPSETANPVPTRTRESFAHIEGFASAPPLLQAKTLKVFENTAKTSDDDVSQFLSVSAGPTSRLTAMRKRKWTSADSADDPRTTPPPASSAISSPPRTQPQASTAVHDTQASGSSSTGPTLSATAQLHSIPRRSSARLKPRRVITEKDIFAPWTTKCSGVVPEPRMRRSLRRNQS